MDATREQRTTLVDLLDRVLEKGAVIDADVIITVAGVPLIGLKLRAMLASIETMIQYGMWADWDRAIRAAAGEEEKRKILLETAMLRGETPLLRCAASYWQSSGACPAWTYGTLTVTANAVRIHQKEPLACLVDVPFESLAGYSLEYGTVSAAAEPTGYLHLVLTDGSVSSLHPAAAEEVIRCIGTGMKQKNLQWRPVECHARMPENFHRCVVKEA
ncbi:MAG: gas vesicle protein [Methanoregula sp.]